MATPESKIKQRVRNVFDKHGCQYLMQVPNGFGKSWLDFTSAHPVSTRIVHVETKAPGNKPTARQRATIRELRAAGHKVFVIDGREERSDEFDTLDDLDAWLVNINN